MGRPKYLKKMKMYIIMRSLRLGSSTGCVCLMRMLAQNTAHYVMEVSQELESRSKVIFLILARLSILLSSCVAQVSCFSRFHLLSSVDSFVITGHLITFKDGILHRVVVFLYILPELDTCLTNLLVAYYHSWNFQRTITTRGWWSHWAAFKGVPGKPGLLHLYKLQYVGRRCDIKGKMRCDRTGLQGSVTKSKSRSAFFTGPSRVATASWSCRKTIEVWLSN